MMDRLHELLSRFDPELPLSQARTIPAEWYTDPVLAQAERERIFGRSWLAVGRTEQIQKPGFFTFDVGGVPILVVRGNDDQLHAFHNVCRHRGARVACEEQGTATGFRCRYHGWTYTSAGQLKHAPEFEGVEDFCREDHGLMPLRLDTWGPLVFVCLTQPAMPLHEWLAPLTRRGMPARLETLAFARRREYRLACNWKVFVDNYLDGGYHVNTIHPSLAGVIDYSQYRTEIDGLTSVQISPLMAGNDASLSQVRQGDCAYYWWIWPNLMINLYEGVMDVNIVLPDGPDRCRVVFDFYFAHSGMTESVCEQSMAVAHQVQEEDMGICEEVQRNLASGVFDTGRFSVKREAGGYHFHQLLARWLG